MGRTGIPGTAKTKQTDEIIQRTGEENKTERTNRRRIGNLLIKANRTGDSVLVRIYISPTQTRERRRPPAVLRTLVRARHGTRLPAPPGSALPYVPGQAPRPVLHGWGCYSQGCV